MESSIVIIVFGILGGFIYIGSYYFSHSRIRKRTAIFQGYMENIKAMQQEKIRNSLLAEFNTSLKPSMIEHTKRETILSQYKGKAIKHILFIIVELVILSCMLYLVKDEQFLFTFMYVWINLFIISSLLTVGLFLLLRLRNETRILSERIENTNSTLERKFAEVSVQREVRDELAKILCKKEDN